jgi:hypothetical protein
MNGIAGNTRIPPAQAVRNPAWDEREDRELRLSASRDRR